MDSVVLQEKNDSYGYTTFYLVQNQQEPTIPVASFLQMNQQVTSVNNQFSNNLRSYYENNDIVENHIVTLNATDNIPRNVSVQQNCDIRKIDYMMLPNNEQKSQQQGQIFTSENPPSHSLLVQSPANVVYVSDNQTLKKCTLDEQIINSSNPLPKTTKKRKIQHSRKTNSTDHTSVCLLKVGNTYHSVSNLNEEQTKLVSQAIENINPDNGPIKPTYDTNTNTRVIYKVVSPNDLKIIKKNRNSTNEMPMDIDKEEKKDQTGPNTIHIETSTETDNKKVTRSGRTVKKPKHIEPGNEENHKSRKKPNASIRCFQCSGEFHGVYQLQRHYEKYPTHTPTNQHTNLFHCLLAILKSCTTYEKTNVFIQQMELLIGKLKLLLPCLLKGEENVENPCTISEELGRLLGINPGTYNLNMDAIHCIKDASGYCKHNPQKTVHLTKTPDPSKPSQLWLTKHKEEIANSDSQSEDCARTNSVDKWPTFNKRTWKIKSSTQNNNVNSILDKENINDENQINIIEKVLESHNDTQGVFSTEQSISDNVIPNSLLEDKNQSNHKIEYIQSYQTSDTESDVSNTPVKFHSAHFDIRSSPIKPTSNFNVFNKIQIRPKTIPKFDLRQPVYTVNSTEVVDIQQETDQPLELPMFTNIQVCNQNLDNTLDNIEIICKEANNPINYNNKEWSNNSNINDLHESYTSNDYIDPSMMHIPKPIEHCSMSNSKDMQRNEHDIKEKSRLQGSSVLHLLDSLGKDCLTFPDSELRNNSIDIPLDLFSFNNN